MKRSKRPMVVDVADCHDSAFVRPVRVLLDGRDLSDCFRAVIYSDGHGEAHVFKTRIGADGKPQKYTEDGRTAAREVLSGVVNIIRPVATPADYEPPRLYRPRRQFSQIE